MSKAILNLTKGHTEIHYEKIVYPDAQQSIRLTPSNIIGIDTIIIKSRMISFLDVEMIICATKSVREMCPDCKIELYVPYFMGARSDRKFEEGGVNYLKHVICPVINSLEFSKVMVLDPHSDVLEGCLNNFEKINITHFYSWARRELPSNTKNVLVVSPDAGAVKRTYDFAKSCYIDNVITASKVRDVKTGKIIKTEVPTITNESSFESIVIVDDICDGGRTFVELAKEIREQTNIPLYLAVTHGIFSSGFQELSKYFEKIITTNSFAEQPDKHLPSLLRVYSVI